MFSQSPLWKGVIVFFFFFDLEYYERIAELEQQLQYIISKCPDQKDIKEIIKQVSSSD